MRIASWPGGALPKESWEPPARPCSLVCGAFDLLHVGHVSLILAASRNAAALVAVVYDDASVRRRKGPDRPVIEQASRARVLASLRRTTHVIIADSDDLSDLIVAIGPDLVYLSVNTWLPEPKRQQISSVARIVYLHRQTGSSTSSVIKRTRYGKSR